MTKTIIKEFFIVLLMIVAIGLLLAFVFYDYIPLNKTVPVKVKAYEMPQEIEDEIGKNAIADEQTIVKTYTIESTDLSLYESNKDYDAGKYNPFALDNVGETSANIGNTSTSNSTSNTNTNIANQNINSLK